MIFTEGPWTGWEVCLEYDGGCKIDEHFKEYTLARSYHRDGSKLQSTTEVMFDWDQKTEFTIVVRPPEGNLRHDVIRPFIDMHGYHCLLLEAHFDHQGFATGPVYRIKCTDKRIGQCHPPDKSIGGRRWPRPWPGRGHFIVEIDVLMPTRRRAPVAPGRRRRPLIGRVEELKSTPYVNPIARRAVPPTTTGWEYDESVPTCKIIFTYTTRKYDRIPPNLPPPTVKAISVARLQGPATGDRKSRTTSAAEDHESQADGEEPDIVVLAKPPIRKRKRMSIDLTEDEAPAAVDRTAGHDSHQAGDTEAESLDCRCRTCRRAAQTQELAMKMTRIKQELGAL